MSLHKIYSRYAKSLIEISQEQDVLDSTIESAKFFLEVNKVRDFRNMLKNPVFKSEIKLKVFDAIFKGKVNEIFEKFLVLTVKKNREILLPEIMEELLLQDKKMKKITDINLTTASQLPEEFIAKLRESLQKAAITAEHLEINTKVDKSIIGGFIIQVEDNLIDNSIITKLKNIEKNIIDYKHIRVI